MLSTSVSSLEAKSLPEAAAESSAELVQKWQAIFTEDLHVYNLQHGKKEAAIISAPHLANKKFICTIECACCPQTPLQIFLLYAITTDGSSSLTGTLTTPLGTLRSK
jgi:hypothetical protein